MNALTTLRIHDFTPMPAEAFNVIQLEALETFELSIDSETVATAFDAISTGCKNLKLLFVKENSHNHFPWDDGCIQAICSMKKLESLIICSRNVGDLRLNRIVQSLPELTSLSLKHFHVETGIYENIPQVIDSCSKLKQLTIEVCSDAPELTVDFLTQIAATTRNNREMRVTLDRNLRLVSYQGEIRNRGVIIYWDGYSPAYSQSFFKLLDLNNECLQKIIGFLDLSSKCELHDTCERTQKLVSNHITDHVFFATLSMDDRIFEKLGKHIRRMRLDINAFNIDNDNDGEIFESWRRFNRMCFKMTELGITSIFYVLNDIRRIPILRWPNMRKLAFSTSYPVSDRVLRSFVCPMLTHLDVRSYVGDHETSDSARDLNHIGTYDHLTSLKVSGFYLLLPPIEIED